MDIQIHNEVKIYDPIADSIAAKQSYGINLLTTPTDFAPYDAVVGAVAHKSFCMLTERELIALLKSDGVLADVKNMWRDLEMPSDIKRWSL